MCSSDLIHSRPKYESHLIIVILVFFLQTGCHGNLPVLNLLSASVAKNQHFRPCRKIYALDRKNDWHLLELSRRSLSACKVGGGEIELRALAVGAKIGVFVCHAWSACVWGT